MSPDDRAWLDSPAMAAPLLDRWGLDDFERGLRNLRGMAATIGRVRLGEISRYLDEFLPGQADPDMALNNLERFVANPAARERLPSLLEAGGRDLNVLLQLVSASQFFSDQLSANPDFFDEVRGPMRRSPSLESLVGALRAEVDSAPDDVHILRAIRQFRQRQHLRIGVNDIVRDRPLEEIARDLSTVAEATLEVALSTAIRNVGNRFGTPRLATGEAARCTVLAFGKLGGEELNYSSDIDLMFLYDDEGETQGNRSIVGNNEFYSRVVQELVRLISTPTDRGQAYRIDLRLRPEGRRGPVARSLASTLSYYDTFGRTWERQALIKVRTVAGDRALGDEFLRAIDGFVWRKYLSFAEINGIKAMKRRIEHKSPRAGDDVRDVKTGHGGIRDVEFTIQFLQLLNGGDLLAVRQHGTLNAMQALESAGCLTDPECRALDDAYRFLRKTEHRLQLMFDWQTHRLPDHADELRKLALRMGYSRKEEGGRRKEELSEIEKAPMPTTADPPSAIRLPPSPQRHSPLDEPPIAASLDTRDLLIDPLEQFLYDYLEKTKVTRTILDHLLHQTFADSEERAEPETDLILGPDPDEAAVQAVLGRYPFKDVMGAYRNLTQLALEAGRFLSTRRCRHFLASIAPKLIGAVAETPDPDMTLVNLEQVSASLGAKAILWELFSFLPASLKLTVDLCSNSPFLSQILINNPGMIDDLLDSLILNQPRTLEELRVELQELCRGVENLDVIEPILRSFQDKELLRIGVRDLIGKEDVRSTTSALSDLAEALLVETAARQEKAVAARHGVPILAEGPCAGKQSRYALLALGKLGGREMSYHSDLDIVLIYEGDGRSEAPPLSEAKQCDNYEYFTELAQRIIRAMSQTGPLGRLYEVDMRLRPTGKSGRLAIPLAEFQRYYDGTAQVWERQALVRARIVHGDPGFARDVMSVAHHAVHGLSWRSEIVDEIRAMRERLETTASPRSLKRGFGGLADIEFMVQMFQVKYGRARPEIARTNTWESLDALRAASSIEEEEHRSLVAGYSFLRFAEARLRIVTNRPLNEYPGSTEELENYARRMGFDIVGGPAADKFLAKLRKHTQTIRELFGKTMERERKATAPGSFVD